MKIAYLTSLFFVSLIILFCVIYSYKKNTKYAKSVCTMLIAGFFTVFMYAISIVTLNITVSRIFTSIYFISIDWLLFFVLYFILDYSDKRNLVARNYYLSLSHSVLLIIAASDTISLVLNYFIHHAFDNVLMSSESSNLYYWNYNFGKGYQFHLLVCYILVFLIMAFFIYSIITSTGALKKHYIYFFTSFLLIIVSNIFYLIQQWPFDYSVLLYGLMTIFICYFSISQREKDKLKVLTEIYSSNIESAMFGYDYEKKCIFITPNTYKIFQNEAQVQEIAQNYLKSDFFLPAMENKTDYISVDDSFIINNQNFYFFVEYKIIRDKKMREIGSFLNFTDRTQEIIELNNKKISLTHDKLTNLLNAETFYERVEEILNFNPEAKRYLIVTDIKDFKFINDVFGSVIGDKILMEEGRILAGFDYPECIQTRLMTDQFAILIKKENFDQQDFMDRLEEIQEITKGLNYRIIINIGIYEINDISDDIKSMIDKAMIVIDQINLEKKGNIAYFNSEMMKNVLVQKEFLSNFYNYLENRQFDVYFEPVYSDRKKTIGYESFVKLTDKEKGTMYMEDFLPYMEKSVFMGMLDEFVWEKVCQTLIEKKWNEKRIAVFIKIFEMDFYYSNLVNSLIDLVNKYDIDSSLIYLEFNEKFILGKEANIRIVNALKEAGFKIVIDDFGSGYSSFYMFEELRPNAIKISLKSFNSIDKKEGGNKKEKIIIQSMLKLAEKINTKLILESVDTKEDFDFLKKMKCKYFQGKAIEEIKEEKLS